METMNDGVYAAMKATIKFDIESKYIENQLNIEIIDLRSVADQHYGHVAEVYLLSDADLLTAKWKVINSNKDDITNMNQVIRLTNSTCITISPLGYYICYTNLDSQITRNLYLQSSVLASYDTLSNFNMATIIKNISVRAPHNELIVDSSMAGFDLLDVSCRSFSRIDSRLTEAFGQTINLKNPHWSMSIIFQRKG